MFTNRSLGERTLGAWSSVTTMGKWRHDEMTLFHRCCRSINFLSDIPILKCLCKNNRLSSLIATFSNWPGREKDVSAFFFPLSTTCGVVCLSTNILLQSLMQLHWFLAAATVFTTVIERVDLSTVDTRCSSLSQTVRKQRKRSEQAFVLQVCSSSESCSAKRWKREIIISLSSKKIDFAVREWSHPFVSQYSSSSILISSDTSFTSEVELAWAISCEAFSTVSFSRFPFRALFFHRVEDSIALSLNKWLIVSSPWLLFSP